jgi:hypothetical protein
VTRRDYTQSPDGLRHGVERFSAGLVRGLKQNYRVVQSFQCRRQRGAGANSGKIKVVTGEGARGTRDFRAVEIGPGQAQGTTCTKGR